MNEAIKGMKAYDEHHNLMRLASAQDDFVQRYASLIPDDRRRDDFRRDLIYLIHLAYREAQEPLVKQLTDFVMAHHSPFLEVSRGV
jgi:hypothetical protein